MAPGLWQLILVVLLVVLLFGGRGRIAAIMGDMAKGVRSFRSGLKPEDEDTSEPDAETEPSKQISAQSTPEAAPAATSKSQQAD